MQNRPEIAESAEPSAKTPTCTKVPLRPAFPNCLARIGINDMIMWKALGVDKSGNRIHFSNATCESTLSTQIWSLKLEDKKHTLHIARSGKILDFN